MTSPLDSVTTFRINRSVVADTIDVLAAAGAEGYEAFVLWGGTIDPTGVAVTFTTMIAPPQTGHRTPDGLLVTVDGNALFGVNRTLYQRGELLAGQVHSHPTGAYHSSTDDHYPLVTLGGALSVVVPDFAQNAPGDIARWAWYRLIGTGIWAPLRPADRIELLD